MSREPRIASHPDDPEAPLADRLLLALGMWPSYVEQMGVEEVIEAAVIIRSQAHRFPMVAEDWGTERAEVEKLRELLECLVDEDECRFDHHGGCQAHGFLSLKPGEICPHAEAKQVLGIGAEE